MKKVTFAFSALAITATVGTAMAHSKVLSEEYCIAYTLNPLNQRIPAPYTGAPTTFTCSLTIGLSQSQDPNFKFYGEPKTPGVACPHVTGCPATNFDLEN